MDQHINKQALTYCPVTWHAKRNPNAIAITTDNSQLTFAELSQRVAHISAQLKVLTMKKGDRLVSIAPNGLALVLLQLACLRHGFIFCPLNPNFSTVEIQQRLALLNTPFIWQPHNKQSLEIDFEGKKNIILATCSGIIDPLAVINIIFTSGSSGTPKAVMHHFSNHYYSALGSQSVIPLTQGDTNLLSLPMFHISGYATVMRTLLAGARVHISTEKLTVHQLKQHNITHLSLVSSQPIKLLQHQHFNAQQLPIKHLLLGGSAFPEAVLQATAQRGFTYHLSYGSTEMSSQIATSTNNQKLQLLPYRHLKMVNQEIQVSGKTRFAGYFTGDSQGGLMDAKQYFASSDIGEFKHPFVKIIGRKDRQFISGGENIQPEEIEKVLLMFPMVSLAYVLPIDDKTYGQRPIAFIKWHQEAQINQLQLFIQDKLTTFKQPQHYFILPEQFGLKPNRQALTDIAQQKLENKL